MPPRCLDLRSRRDLVLRVEGNRITRIRIRGRSDRRRRRAWGHLRQRCAAITRSRVDAAAGSLRRSTWYADPVLILTARRSRPWESKATPCSSDRSHPASGVRRGTVWRRSALGGRSKPRRARLQRHGANATAMTGCVHGHVPTLTLASRRNRCAAWSSVSSGGSHWRRPVAARSCSAVLDLHARRTTGDRGVLGSREERESPWHGTGRNAASRAITRRPRQPVAPGRWCVMP